MSIPEESKNTRIAEAFSHLAEDTLLANMRVIQTLKAERDLYKSKYAALRARRYRERYSAVRELKDMLKTVETIRKDIAT